MVKIEKVIVNNLDIVIIMLIFAEINKLKKFSRLLVPVSDLKSNLRNHYY